MLKQILVPLDGSRAAERALKLARYLAEGSNGEIRLVRVLQSTALAESLERPLPAEILAQEQEHCTNYLARVADSLRAHGHAASFVVLDSASDPGEAILDEAVHRPVDLICMSSYGKTSGSRYFTGTVAEKVARFAPCPVLLVGRKVANGTRRGRRAAVPQ